MRPFFFLQKQIKNESEYLLNMSSDYILLIVYIKWKRVFRRGGGGLSLTWTNIHVFLTSITEWSSWSACWEFDCLSSCFQLSGRPGSHFMGTSAASWWPSPSAWHTARCVATWARRCLWPPPASAFVPEINTLEILLFKPFSFLFFFFQKNVEGINHCCRLYCVLSAGLLSCYFTPEEIEAKVPPTLQVAIDKVWTASNSHTMVEWFNLSLTVSCMNSSLRDYMQRG